MKNVAQVAIHASQFPEHVRRDLLTSLRTRRVNHKFHYDSIRQTQKWLALHETHSPARQDADCLATYERAFVAAAEKITAKQVHILGLGCGGGQKDTRLLELLKARGKQISYTPCDVSPAMVLVARQAALKILPAENCLPFVCDLATADDLAGYFPDGPAPRAPRLMTFFGMIPNFEPDEILPKLAALVRPKDFLLFSANLSPGKNYAAGLKKILPQYDNALTHDWLLAFLLDLGVEKADGAMRFEIETVRKTRLKRVLASFHFKRARRLAMDGEVFTFQKGDAVRLFFSYRYPPERVEKILGAHGLKVCESWITKSAEEGVFLVKRRSGPAGRR